MTDLATARQTVSDLETEITKIEADIATLEGERATLQGRLSSTRRALSEANAEVARTLREPAAETDLTRLLPLLRTRLERKLHETPNSPTALSVRAELHKLEADKNSSAGDRLSRVKALSETLAESYQRDRDTWDAIESRNAAALLRSTRSQQ